MGEKLDEVARRDAWKLQKFQEESLPSASPSLVFTGCIV